MTVGSGGTTSTDTYVDRDDELTTVQGFRTEYNVNDETGEVTVAGVYDLNAATQTNVANTKYDEEVGATVYVSGGQLTTDETTAGESTEGPLATLDGALAQVDSLRSELGAVQNRFESAITNLSNNETNLSAARSRIEDADYATEVANMTRSQILQQAGTSVLAQANQLPQNVLSLLG
ncbi:flagellin [Vreelandella lionensis]|uniref:flagellin n=1 Tax=Vreelandella lionensis TaxID=1144478 RepID=UPI00111C1FD9